MISQQNHDILKLDQIQNVVDEKLQKTLESRLSQSFDLVSKQLESVGQGLGKMKALAADAKSLKNALTNVKERGIEQRSQEVWDTLRSVKREFSKFEIMLDKAQKQIQTADKTISDIVGTRTRAINRALRSVETISTDENISRDALSDTEQDDTNE